MSWNPLNTLTGRMVLVTVVAVALSYAAAFALFANERGAALRRAAEGSMIERVAFTAERLRDAQNDQRAFIVDSIRDFGIRYSIAAAPGVVGAPARGPSERVARAISERLGGADVRASAQIVQGPAHHWRGRRGRERENEDFARLDERRRRHVEAAGRMMQNTEMRISVLLDDNVWLNARAHLPGPRPPPWSVLLGALVSVVAVGIGASLVSRQIGAPLAHLANAARALGAGQDNVTAPVSGPDDVRRASTAFNAMADRLGRQLNRQRQMLWALSHDLRTPITALRLRAELIEDEALRERFLAPMEQLTEQALSLARAGASDERRTRVDLAEITRTLCGELQDMGIDARAQADIPVLVECRPSEIARALRNLAENAVKHGGGGTIRVTRSEGGDVEVEVTDEGPGVSPDILRRLSEPFFRADSARSGRDGAGLGLAIAQAIADGHGGRLDFANRSPRGFSAKLILPG